MRSAEISVNDTNVPLPSQFKSSVHIEFSDVSYDVQLSNRLHVLPQNRKPQLKRILHQVSGFVRAGESLAILGPSGSGKTTLLNLLAGRANGTLSQGRILFSGQCRTPRTRRLIGYVTQDDVFLSKLTVRETLIITARLRLPQTLTYQQKLNHVDDLIKKLRLDKCQHTHVGDPLLDKGISGGERKRLNIANELMHKPNVFLADEYTSGLDSSSALTVTKMLTGLCCENGMTVVATIHQPSSNIFRMFSKVLLLVSGRVAYFGTPQAIVDYFSTIGFHLPYQQYNPADFAMDLAVNDEAGASESGTLCKSPQTILLDSWQARQANVSKESPLHVPYVSVDLRTPHDTSASPGETSDSSHTNPDLETSGNRRVFISAEEIGASNVNEVFNGTNVAPPPSTYFGRMKRALWKRGSWLLSMCDIRSLDTQSVEDKYASSWWAQTSALAYRAMRQKRGMLLDRITMVQVLVVTVVLALFWWRTPSEESSIEDRLGFLSAIGVYWGSFSSSAAVFSFPREKKVLNKDRSCGMYRLSAYFFAKTIVSSVPVFARCSVSHMLLSVRLSCPVI